MKIKKFLGINNVAHETRLEPGEFTAAANVDVDSRNKLRSRVGRTLLRAGAAHSVFEAPFGVLAVVDSDLVLHDATGAVLRVVYPSLGYTRVWYVLLVDGRVGFSNGLISGITTATTTAPWGLPTPASAGVGIEGTTRYQVTHVNLSTKLEGPPTYGELIDTTQAIIGLPLLAGFSTNVYFAPYGDAAFLAGTTTTDTFQHDGSPLGAQYVGSGLASPPVGTLMTKWKSRVLIAEGSVLWATQPFQPELCNVAEDFVQLPEAITLVYGNDQGVFVGTGAAMYFLSGPSFRELTSRRVVDGHVVLGSGVEIDLSYMSKESRPQGADTGALCIANRKIQLLYGAGEIRPLVDQYETAATEVFATTRIRNDSLQYLAAPV